jgi:hypothetical protein
MTAKCETWIPQQGGESGQMMLVVSISMMVNGELKTWFNGW